MAKTTLLGVVTFRSVVCFHICPTRSFTVKRGQLSNDSSKIGHRVQQRGDKGNHRCVIRLGYCYSPKIRPLHYLSDIFWCCVYVHFLRV